MHVAPLADPIHALSGCRVSLELGDCFDPVPLYRVPPTRDLEYLDILQWAADYQACDTLQMHCTTGERFGERQLVGHDSSLTAQGREICRRLSAKTGLPAYYYLHNSRGRSLRDERRRRCPGCRRNWSMAEPWHGRFDFKCERCLLLSNIATNVVAR